MEKEMTPKELRFKFGIEIGKNLRQLREAAGVDRHTLAKALGYAEETSIQHIEAGRTILPTWTLTTVCQVLKITLDELIVQVK